MSKDSTSLTSVNINQIFPVTSKTGFISFIQRQDEVIYPKDNIVLQTNCIIQNKIDNPKKFVNSLINVQDVKSKTIKINSNIFFNTDWITYFLLFCFILYAFLQKTFYKKQRVIFSSFFNYRYTNQLIREGNLYNESGFYLLLILSLLSFGLLFLNWVVYYSYGNFLNINSLILFLKVFAVFAVFYFGKILFLLFLSNIFKLNKLCSDFVLSQHVFFISFGILALFLSVIVFFSTSRIIVISSIIIFISFYVNYLFRLYILTLGSGFFSLFYYFLYICTVEILPLLVVYKMINK